MIETPWLICSLSSAFSMNIPVAIKRSPKRATLMIQLRPCFL